MCAYVCVCVRACARALGWDFVNPLLFSKLSVEWLEWGFLKQQLRWRTVFVIELYPRHASLCSYLFLPTEASRAKRLTTVFALLRVQVLPKWKFLGTKLSCQGGQHSLADISHVFVLSTKITLLFQILLAMSKYIYRRTSSLKGLCNVTVVWKMCITYDQTRALTKFEPWVFLAKWLWEGGGLKWMITWEDPEETFSSWSGEREHFFTPEVLFWQLFILFC